MSTQSSEEELKKAYNLLEKGDAMNAKQILADALEYDLENKEINFAHWCCAFWAEYIDKISLTDASVRGDGLINRWISFKTLLEREEREKTIQPRAVYITQKCVFTLASAAFKELENNLLEKNSSSNEESSSIEVTQCSEIYRKAGLCHKKLGEYETALNYLMQANSLTPSSAKILAEMADCYALCGEEKNAKVLFREAFFIDAQKIDVVFLESELILCLINQVKELGYTGSALLEWIPVYGILQGVFNVKRQMKTQEIGKLKQDIFAKMNELKDPTNNTQVLTPKLINMHFWLIDYYSRSNDSYAENEIKNCELQIRVLDDTIYRLYKR